MWAVVPLDPRSDPILGCAGAGAWSIALISIGIR